jgi:hypothetical protein
MRCQRGQSFGHPSRQTCGRDEQGPKSPGGIAMLGEAGASVIKRAAGARRQAGEHCAETQKHRQTLFLVGPQQRRLSHGRCAHPSPPPESPSLRSHQIRRRCRPHRRPQAPRRLRPAERRRGELCARRIGAAAGAAAADVILRCKRTPKLPQVSHHPGNPHRRRPPQPARRHRRRARRGRAPGQQRGAVGQGGVRPRAADVRASATFSRLIQPRPIKRIRAIFDITCPSARVAAAAAAPARRATATAAAATCPTAGARPASCRLWCEPRPLTTAAGGEGAGSAGQRRSKAQRRLQLKAVPSAVVPVAGLQPLRPSTEPQAAAGPAAPPPRPPPRRPAFLCVAP